ncbi:hypothetical protein LEP1GSC047_2924 [Leptospira inadai serovar Lyme str. 10]|uniref:Uncharacterized protein n=1 Tax=Leptospira inadai serovar Lyme str. 10 TaxID=1049790 RepID=V6HCW9_9LEPT|nr:hypothetical protein LEP1GSC047_2924 [Leptospira inadai serovar Lyme str. 10]
MIRLLMNLLKRYLLLAQARLLEMFFLKRIGKGKALKISSSNLRSISSRKDSRRHPSEFECH